MQILIKIMIWSLIGYHLLGCTDHSLPPQQLANNFLNRQSLTPTTKEKFPPKNPTQVALYTKSNIPVLPYRIIGIASISKYNLIGKLRDQIVLADMIKKLAASMGGDGLINLTETKETVVAHVIIYERIII